MEISNKELFDEIVSLKEKNYNLEGRIFELENNLRESEIKITELESIISDYSDEISYKIYNILYLLPFLNKENAKKFIIDNNYFINKFQKFFSLIMGTSVMDVLWHSKIKEIEEFISIFDLISEKDFSEEELKNNDCQEFFNSKNLKIMEELNK